MLELRGISLLRIPFASIVTILLSQAACGLTPHRQDVEAHLPVALESEALATQLNATHPAEYYWRFWRRLAVTMGPPGLVLGMFSMAFHIRERRRYREQLSRVSKDLAAAGESERTRIARELHDSVCQWLMISKHSFERAIESANASDPNYLQHLRRGVGNLEECIRETRRISHDLKPALPANQPFAEALATLIHEFSARTRVDVRVDGLDCGKGQKLSPRTQFALYRTTQEALMNIEKHANASQIALALTEEQTPGQVTLTILDNGCGIRRVASSDYRAGIGVSNMRERIAEVGGALTLRSSANGTEVIATVPTLPHSSGSDPTRLKFLQDEAPA
jgi:two-component system NarL family sensor kinase